MAYEQKDNSASLFKNDKGGNDKRPDYRGNGMVNGKLVKLAAWVQTAQKSGEKYLAIKFEEPQAAPATSSPNPVDNGEETGLPF